MDLKRKKEQTFDQGAIRVPKEKQGRWSIPRGFNGLLLQNFGQVSSLSIDMTPIQFIAYDDGQGAGRRESYWEKVMDLIRRVRVAQEDRQFTLK